MWGLILGVRAYGFNADANLFGVLAASMIPLTIYYRRHAPRRANRSSSTPSHYYSSSPGRRAQEVDPV